MARHAAPASCPSESCWEVADAIGAERRPESDAYSVDISKGRFPFSLVWTPLPLITWFLPIVGHLGICDSRGVAYDFAGPYTIGVDDLAFGSAVRVLRLDPGTARREQGVTPAQAWDAAVDSGCDVYKRRMHNLFCDNCHSHVARCLNVMAYGGRTDWNMVTLALWIAWRGSWVSWGRALQVWLPFLIIVALVAFVSTLRR